MPFADPSLSSIPILNVFMTKPPTQNALVNLFENKMSDKDRETVVIEGEVCLLPHSHEEDAATYTKLVLPVRDKNYSYLLQGPSRAYPRIFRPARTRRDTPSLPKASDQPCKLRENTVVKSSAR